MFQHPTLFLNFSSFMYQSRYYVKNYLFVSLGRQFLKPAFLWSNLWSGHLKRPVIFYLPNSRKTKTPSAGFFFKLEHWQRCNNKYYSGLKIPTQYAICRPEKRPSSIMCVSLINNCMLKTIICSWPHSLISKQLNYRYRIWTFHNYFVLL